MKLRWKLGANISNDATQAERDVALLALIGGRVARVSQEGPDAFARLATFRKACDAHGLELFQCAQTPGHVAPKTQAGIDAYAADVAHQSTVAHRVSTGNEVNGFGSNETPNPTGQAELFLACAEAVAKLNPGARLATPSLCPASGKLGSSYVDPLLFFDAMIAAEPTMLDVTGVEVDWHGYGPFNQPADTQATWNTAWRTLALDDDLAKLGHRRVRITWSEFGEPVGNGGGTPQFQADQFVRYLAMLASPAFAHVNMGELCWYQLRDDGQSGWPGTCGLFDATGHARPIVARFTEASKVAA